MKFYFERIAPGLGWKQTRINYGKVWMYLARRPALKKTGYQELDFEAARVIDIA